MDTHYNFAFLDEGTKKMIRRALLKAVSIPGYQVPFGSREMPFAYGWGTGGVQVTASIIGQDDVLKVIDQGSDDTTNAVNIRRFFARTTGVPTTEKTDQATIIQTRHRIPEKPLTEAQILVFQVPMPEPLFRLEPRRRETITMHALAEYGLMNVKLYEDIAQLGAISRTYDYPVLVNERYLTSPSPIPKFDNPKMHMNPALQLFGAGREKRLYAIPPYTSVRSLDFEDHPFAVQRWDHACALCGAQDSFLDEMIVDDAGSRLFVCSDSDYCGERRASGNVGTQQSVSVKNALAEDSDATLGGCDMNEQQLLSVRGVGKQFLRAGRAHWACRDVSFDLYPGEVLAVVGESGSGKTTLLRLLAARLACDEGAVHYHLRSEGTAESAKPEELVNLAELSEARLRWLARTDWGFVEQHARDGLRMNVSGGANVGERLMALGARHYGKLRSEALSWMQRVELDTTRIDDLPGTYSGGMQQRLQIARNLVTHPRLVFMDEPTTGLDVSVQARLLDLLRELVDELQLAAVVVTHDLAVARLLAHRMLVMKDGVVVEQGLTDRVLDDPQHAYTQLLVSSVLTP